MAKIRVGVIFGGRSGEHEVSLMSARSVINSLDRTKYEVIPIGINKQGQWMLAEQAIEMIEAGKFPQLPESLENADSQGLDLVPKLASTDRIDVVFPVLHGPYGEDGTIQGFLELANIPYVGAGVTSSAISMDKAMMRVVFANAGLPLAPWTAVKRSSWEQNRELVLENIIDSLGLPCFVKPANLGSSVGVSKARSKTELIDALNLAAEYDRKIVVEQAVEEAREIEVSVLGNDNPQVSVAGEIIPANEFYDYQAKYFNDNSQLIIPARLTDEQMERVREYARRAFLAVDCAGMARVDFFVDSRGEVILNEINTIPGFTKISMYPKLWQASGLPYPQLLEKLIELALERHRERQRTRFSV